MQKKAINIAIDGYSSTGKSTLARELAARLGYRYIDSGAMYRGVTLYAIQHNFIHGEQVDDQLVDHLDKIQMEFRYNKERSASDLILNGENVEDRIRQLYVAQHVSAVAAIPQVRRHLVKQQKQMAEKKAVVMDGRDIGTVVLPEAELKMFVTARDAVRTDRRYKELLARGEDITREEVAANIRQRDLMDTSREDSPLIKADDALLLDNSEIDQEEQLDIALRWALQALNSAIRTQKN